MHLNINDGQHDALLAEIETLSDEPLDVFFFDHWGGEEGHEIHTRTAVINWGSDEWLILQTHNWVGESEVHTVRIPGAVARFVVEDYLARSVYCKGHQIWPDGRREDLHFRDWERG